MGTAAKRRRAELGLTQAELLDRMEPPLGIETLRRVEAGDQPNYRLTTLAAVSRALGWPANALEQIAHGENPPADELDPRRLDQIEERLNRLEGSVDALLAQLEGGEPS